MPPPSVAAISTSSTTAWMIARPMPSSGRSPGSHSASRPASIPRPESATSTVTAPSSTAIVTRTSPSEPSGYACRTTFAQASVTASFEIRELGRVEPRDRRDAREAEPREREVPRVRGEDELEDRPRSRLAA